MNTAEKEQDSLESLIKHPKIIVSHHLINLQTFNHKLESTNFKSNNAKSNFGNKSNKNKAIFTKIDNALENHRMNMINLESFNEYYHFGRIKKFIKIDSLENLEVLEMFVKCQLEYRMTWLYSLSEEKLNFLTPL